MRAETELMDTAEDTLRKQVEKATWTRDRVSDVVKPVIVIRLTIEDAQELMMMIQTLRASDVRGLGNRNW